MTSPSGGVDARSLFAEQHGFMSTNLKRIPSKNSNSSYIVRLLGFTILLCYSALPMIDIADIIDHNGTRVDQSSSYLEALRRGSSLFLVAKKMSPNVHGHY